MEKSSPMLIIVMLIVGLGIGGGIGYYMAPAKEIAGETVEVTVEVSPLEGKTVKVGHVASDTSAIETELPQYESIISPAINDFVKELGYDITFEYLIDDCQGQAAIHLEKVQSYKAMDINLVVGGEWSSQASAALSYVNENDMLLFSPSSTSPLLAIPDDNLYRMCPTDLVQAPAIAEMLWNWGIKAVIVIQRGDAWADGIYNILEPEFEARGGVILEKIRYAAEATEFSSYLATADDIAKAAVDQYGAEHVAVDMISFAADGVPLVTQAKDYPTLYGLTWFGSDGTAMTQQHVDDAPEVSTHLVCLSTYAAPAESPKFRDLNDACYALYAQPAGYYTACRVDINWVLMEAVLETQSTDALDVIPLLDMICNNAFGTSGWNRLNADGDRYASNYDIWGFGYGPDGVTADHIKYGLYDGVTEKVIWYPQGVTPKGETVPGVVPPGQ
jgi:branched-chain amino acid transport system substrate-binding protein